MITSGALAADDDGAPDRTETRLACAPIDGSCGVDVREAVALEAELAALERDEAAALRDEKMDRLDAAAERFDNARAKVGMEVVVRAAGQRKRAEEHRAISAEHRATAAADREAAALDRERGALEREQARTEIEALARRLAVAEAEALVGISTQADGLAELEREIERCRAVGASLVVASVEWTEPDSIDSGDEPLRRAAALVRAHVRSFDRIIGLGSHSFACVFSGLPETNVRQRLGAAARAITGCPDAGTLTVHVTELAPGENAAALLVRPADSGQLSRSR